MDKEQLLLDIIHRIEYKLDKVEEQVAELTALKNKVLGIAAVASIIITIVINYLKGLFAAN